MFSQLIPKHLELSLDIWINESFKFLLSPKLREEPAYVKSHRKRASEAVIRLWRKSMSGVASRVGLQSVGCLMVTKSQKRHYEEERQHGETDRETVNFSSP